MRLRILLLVLIVLFSLNLSAQRWKAERSSLIFTAGTANYMGDFGGGSKGAAHFLGLRDIDIQGTRFNVGLGYEYRVWERLSIRTSLSYAQLYGSDEFTDNLIRHNRNLHFKSNVWGGDLDLKFFLVKESPYRVNYFSGFPFTWSYLRQLSYFFNLYTITGAGLISFKPKTFYNNNWVELQKLSTEKNINNNTIANSYNLGLGLGSRIRHFKFTVEITNKYTSTDYLDDVSGNYYNNDLLRQEYGDLTADLSDRRIDKTIGGTERGNSAYNDSYFFINFVFQYKIPRYKIRNLFSPREEKIIE